LELEERDYFKEPFSQQEILDLAGPVGLSELFARRSPSLKKLGLAGQDLPDDQMLRLMLEEPRLIRRPLVKVGDKLLIGANLKMLAEALESV
jgi:arsenate reductase-like glutaredoxin family protein